MVFYFTSAEEDNGDVEKHVIYMGKDKFENEDLIKFGFEEDIWFHADNLSSAHVYLRMNPGETWESLPQSLLNDCAQLTKANSIQGNKRDNIQIIYTPWSNLKKNSGMDTGQVTFHKSKCVKKVFVETRENAIVNRLNKTKKELYPDLNQEKIQHMKRLRKGEYENTKNERESERVYIEQKRAEKLNSDYSNIITEDAMLTNVGLSSNKTVQELEEDFM